MSKEYTSYLKGVAILMMVFLHLFNNLQNDMSLGCFLMIGDTPLVYIISRMCNPVPVFLILSGYGLYSVYMKRGGVNSKKRIRKLYIHLWIIYLLMIPLAHFVKPNLYPGSLVTFLENATSWKCSYIGEQWFFFPYLILMSLSKYLFRLFDKLNGKLVLIVTATVYGFTILILKMVGESSLCNNMLLYNPFLSLHLLFPFTLGYLAKKYEWTERLKIKVRRTGTVVLILILLCITRCCIPHAFISPLFAIFFVLLFAVLPIEKAPAAILKHLGKHSMNIWLIHTWFSTRLFHDFIFDKVQYPLLMFIGLLTISLLVSYIIEFVYRMQDFLREKFSY